MNIRDLEYIIAVDELKSFVKAARKCFVSQPALSMQIQKAEDMLNVQIFERGRRQVVTTSEGKKVVMHAKDILKHFEYLKNIKLQSNEIKIGLIHTVSTYLLPKIITSLQKDFENIKMYFVEGKTLELLEDLDKGVLDGMIGANNMDEGYEKRFPHIVNNLLYKEEFFLCLPKDHKTKIINEKSLTKDELKEIVSNEQIILMEEGHCMKADITQICSFYGSTTPSFKNSNFLASSIETMKHMIKLKNGIGILPKLSIEKGESGLSFFALPGRHYREVCFFYRKNSSKIALIESIGKVIVSSVGKFLK